MSQCQYRRDQYQCPWDSNESTSDGFCILHDPARDKSREVFSSKLTAHREKHGDIFIGFIFPASFSFRNDNFAGTADFCDTEFTGNADFESAVFQGDAAFRGAKFHLGCRFRKATFSKKASFHKAMFKGDADFTMAGFSNPEFTGAQFDKAIFSSAKFDGVADFSGITFSEGADFGSALFAKVVDFGHCHFKGETDFRNTKFARQVCFEEAKLDGAANFYEAEFHGKADFIGAEFNSFASFLLAEFTGETDFVHSNFDKDVDFGQAVFAGETKFLFTVFGGKTDFQMAKFSGETDFGGTEFDKIVIFKGTKFVGRAFFYPIQVRDEHVRIFYCAQVDFRRVVLDQPEALVMRDADLRMCRFLGTDVRKAEFTAVLWPTIKSRFGVYDQICTEQNGQTEDYPHVERVYRELKQNYEDRRAYERASDFHYGEKEMRRNNPQTQWGLWILLYAYLLVSGYGERWLRPLFWAIALLLVCTALYIWLGLKPSGGGPELEATSTWDWLKSSFYSFRVMTLLRPEDLVPIRYAKLVKAFENLAGPILIGLCGLAIRQRLKR